MNFYEPLYEFEPGEYPIFIRRMPGKVRDLIWTPFTVRCAACFRRHSCKCASQTKRSEIRSRPYQEPLMIRWFRDVY